MRARDLQIRAYVGLVLVFFGVCGIAPLYARSTADEFQNLELTRQYNLDFEDGLRGWNKSGTAFDTQPIAATSIRTNDVLKMPLAGDYWLDLPYRMGHHGVSLIHTSDPLKGTLLSGDIALDAGRSYFSVRVGGGNSLDHEYVELQVLMASAEDLAVTEREFTGWAKNRGVDSTVRRDGLYLGVFRVTGTDSEALRQELFQIPDFLLRRHARIKVVDDATGAWGHINVDFPQFTTQAPSFRPPVWGFADYHSHPMAHLGFGALQGVRTFWGVPGSGFEDYRKNPSLVSRDIPACTPGHGGGPTAEVFINTDEHRFTQSGPLHDLWSWMTGRVTRHPRSGGPQFSSFPSFLSGAHETMHITQIHRAWEGGLRLMTAIAIHNEGVEFLTAKLSDGHIDTSSERDVLEAQVCATRQIAAANQEWMALAYTPEEARNIINQGKLAVILAVEMDELGSLSGFSSLPEEVQYLWDLGIRQVTPIHGIDNRLGGPAIFQPVYNSLNDLLNRGELSVRSEDLPTWPAKFYSVREGGCPSPVPAEARGECVLYRLDPAQERVALKKYFPVSPFHVAPYIKKTKVPAYREFAGHLNQQGMTTEGNTYIRELMRHGMLVDLAHMSERSVSDVYHLDGTWLAERGHPECAAFGSELNLPPSCYDNAYPMMVSHVLFRALSVQDRSKTTVPGFLPEEYDVSEHQLELLHRTGGLIGPFVSENPIDPPPGLVAPFENDCAMSSKSFGYSYRYGLEKMNRIGVGFATDLTFIAGVAPRFGSKACWAYHLATNPGKERSLSPNQYQMKSQRDGVVYANRPAARGVLPGRNTPLAPYRMGEHTYDFNVEGLANYGMLPDLLQDLKNVGLSKDDLDALFSSAEGYIQTWEKAERLSDCGGKPCPFTPRTLDCEKACNGLCPDSPNAGAPAILRKRK